MRVLVAGMFALTLYQPAVSALMGFATTVAQTSTGAWYLMVPDISPPRHIDSYDTAAECRAGIAQRKVENEAMVKRLEAVIGARQRKGETIKDNDIQVMALNSAVRVMLYLPLARCEVQCAGSR